MILRARFRRVPKHCARSVTPTAPRASMMLKVWLSFRRWSYCKRTCQSYDSLERYYGHLHDAVDPATTDMVPSVPTSTLYQLKQLSVTKHMPSSSNAQDTVRPWLHAAARRRTPLSAACLGLSISTRHRSTATAIMASGHQC